MVDFGSPVDVPWPVATDNLIVSGDDWQATACLEWAQGSDVVRALGYERAAEVMFDEIGAGRDQDLLIYPFAFCWRHHLELQLKTLILAASHFLDEPLSDTNEAELNGHRLVPLWATCRPLLDRIEPHEPAHLDTAGRQIAKMHQIDPSGEAFRYAASKARKRYLTRIIHSAVERAVS